MKPRAVLVLALVVLALAAFIWFVERDLPSSEERAERARKLLPVESGEVTAVALEWGGRTVRLERAAGGADGDRVAGEAEGAPEAGRPREWRLTEPVAARADRTAVEGLLGALAGLERLRVLDGVEPGEAGLDPPRGRVTLVTGAGERTLEVGAEVPASENVLVSFAGEPGVFVTRRAFTAQLEREPGEWRSREVLAVTRDRVARVALRRAGAEGPVVLERREGRFHLAAPVADLADSDLVERLLTDLVTLRAQRFLDAGEDAPPPGAPAELGLEPPLALIEVELEAASVAGAPGAAAPVRVELGLPVEAGDAFGAVYARVGEQLFETVTDLDEAAGRPAGEWRSRAWTELRSYDVDRVEVSEAGEPPFELVRDGVDWRRGEQEIPYSAASDLLFALTRAAGEVAEGPGADDPGGEPVLTVSLLPKEGEEETLTLHPERAGRFPARSSVRAALLLLSAEDVAEIREAVAAARTAEAVTDGHDGDDGDDGDDGHDGDDGL